MSTKVSSVRGYRTSECSKSTLYMKGYDCECKSERPPPKIRSSWNRKRSSNENDGPIENEPLLENKTFKEENIELDYVASESPADNDHEASFLLNQLHRQSVKVK